MTSISRASACVALMGGLLWVGTAHAVDPLTKCEEAELKAGGKLQLCLKKSAAKVVGGKPDASAKCQAKFAAFLNKQFNGPFGECLYVDNGDGTVTDLTIGVQWEKKDNLANAVNDADPHDYRNNYSWSASGTAPDGTVFTDFLAKLNNGASPDGTAITGCFAGHCDWRLPTIAELQTLWEPFGVCGGGSGGCVSPILGPTLPILYWSSTTYGTDLGAAWLMNFGDDSGGHPDSKTATLPVRAVRGGF